MSWAERADRMLGKAVRAHSTPVQYIPKTGTAYDIVAVFDKSHIEIDRDTGAAISSTDPLLGVQLSQLQSLPRKGDRVSVNGTVYVVADYQPDGVAGARLKLHEQ